MRSTTCYGNVLFAEKKYMNYITYIMKIRDLSVENLYVEKYDIFKNLVAKIFF